MVFQRIYRRLIDLLDVFGSPADGQVLQWSAAGSRFQYTNLPAGASTFAALSDTPASYAGQASKFLVVNAAADGIDYLEPAIGNILGLQSSLDSKANAADLTAHEADASAHGATDSNIAGAIVRRDASGDFSARNATLSQINSAVADGSMAVALTVDTDVQLGTNGALLLRVKNHGANKFWIDKDGNTQAFGTMTANVFAGSGALLVNLDATRLTGTVNDSRLSTNIPKLSASNTFTGVARFSGSTPGMPQVIQVVFNGTQTGYIDAGANASFASVTSSLKLPWATFSIGDGTGDSYFAANDPDHLTTTITPNDDLANVAMVLTNLVAALLEQGILLAA